MDPKIQPSRNPTSFAAAKEIATTRSAGAEPLAMTQEEVEVMAKGGPDTIKIVERLANRGGSVAAFSEKASPVDVTAADIENISKSGVLPDKIRHALDQAGRPPAEAIDRKAVTQKTGPTEVPPEAYKSKD